MSELVNSIEFAVNQEPRCPCVLLLDTSGSMDGTKIQEVNAGLVQLKTELDQDPLAKKRVEIAIITFDTSITLVQDFVTVDNFVPPVLQANGATTMAGGIREALGTIESRKLAYRENGVTYFRPWLFMITDGEPTDEADVFYAAQLLAQSVQEKKTAFFAVGVDGANMEKLKNITPRHGNPPLSMRGLQFREMFRWLSVSLQSVSHSRPGDMVPLPTVTWGYQS